MEKKLILIGIDGLDPGLIGRWKNELPNINQLIETGTFFPRILFRRGHLYIQALIRLFMVSSIQSTILIKTNLKISVSIRVALKAKLFGTNYLEMANQFA